MIRALYTAATGMNAQQANIDNVAHNLANVNTTGFKKSRVEFEDLVYQQIKAPGSPTSQEAEAPVGLEAGLGSRAVATARNFQTGNLKATNNPLDLAIEGQGFFQLSLPGGETGYTRNGSFTRRADGLLTTAEGEPVLGENGQIRLGPGKMTVDQDGTIRTGETIAGRLRLVDFDESNIDRESGARFRAMPGVKPRPATGKVMGGSLEQANVGVVDRMVALTEIKRSFEALQRGATVLMNDVDGRAINELGRRS